MYLLWYNVLSNNFWSLSSLTTKKRNKRTTEHFLFRIVKKVAFLIMQENYLGLIKNWNVIMGEPHYDTWKASVIRSSIRLGCCCWINPVLMTDWAGEAQEPCVLPQAVQMSPHTPLTPTILQEKRIIPALLTAICVVKKTLYGIESVHIILVLKGWPRSDLCLHLYANSGMILYIE